MTTRTQQGRGVRIARKLIIDLSVMVAIGIVLALLAPLGTIHMSLPSRIIYWVTLGVAGYCCYNPLGSLILNYADELQLPEWLLWVATVLLATVPMSIIVWVVNFMPGPIPFPGVETAVLHYLSVLLVGAVITLMFNLIPATRANSWNLDSGSVPDPEITSEASRDVRFLDRLPPELGTNLIALEMEDHYVRAHTVLGSELVLMRMRDAVAELDGLEGEQVHRSWWVARGSVEDVKREGRNVRLVLEGGLEAPVSRANVTPLKEKGWL